MMASGFEHEIVVDCLSTAAGLRLVVLSQNEDEDSSDLADKWLRQLHVMLPKIDSGRIAILVNVDNIHYKYGVFRGDTVLDKIAFQLHIDSVFEEDSDDDELL